MIEKIILKKSAVLDKMPATEQLEYGEIALNFNTMNPFISFKDTADGIRQIRDYSNEIQNINGSLTDAKNEIDYLRPLVTDNNTNLMFLRSDFEDFKTDNTNEINALRTDITTNSNEIANRLTLTDFNAFKADNTKTINALDSNVSQNSSEIQDVNGVVQQHSIKLDTINATIEQKADKTDLDTKVNKTDIAQTTGTSETSVMSQKAVSDIIGNVEQLLNSI